MRILIVDDHAPVRALARVYAEQAGAREVVEAPDGFEALRLSRAERYDLAIVDYHMPGLDGLETTRALLAHDPALAVVAWTSVIDCEIEQAFLDAGALCHVPKTDTDALSRIIRERLTPSTAHRAASAA